MNSERFNFLKVSIIQLVIIVFISGFLGKMFAAHTTIKIDYFYNFTQLLASLLGFFSVFSIFLIDKELSKIGSLFRRLHLSNDSIKDAKKTALNSINHVNGSSTVTKFGRELAKNDFNQLLRASKSFELIKLTLSWIFFVFFVAIFYSISTSYFFYFLKDYAILPEVSAALIGIGLYIVSLIILFIYTYFLKEDQDIINEKPIK